MKDRFVLFDFDGVIADSFALAFEISRHFTPELDEVAYRRLFEGNVYESLRKLGAASSDDGKAYFEMFEPRFRQEAYLIAGMPEVIIKLHEEYTLAIISSTINSPIEWFLAQHELASYFSDVMGKDVHTSKVEKMRMLFDKYDTDATHCVFITDTLGDMREAEAHSMGAIGVAWGFHERATLERGMPFRIVNKPKELPDAVADYFAQ